MIACMYTMHTKFVFNTLSAGHMFGLQGRVQQALVWHNRCLGLCSVIYQGSP